MVLMTILIITNYNNNHFSNSIELVVAIKRIYGEII